MSDVTWTERGYRCKCGALHSFPAADLQGMIINECECGVITTLDQHGFREAKKIKKRKK